MAEQLEAVVRAPKKDDTHFPPDIRAKAEQLSYFHVDRPSNAIDGIANSEYNFIKGAVAGPVMLVTAPFIGASEEMKGKQGFYDQATSATVGFGNGLVRGVTGCASLVATGVVTGTNQLRAGFTQTRAEPGQGRGLHENFRHVVDTPYTDLCLNKESESFQADCEAMIADGSLKKFDADGREIKYQYQFFVTNEPKDFFEGLGGLQYNVGKGFLAGAALAASAPILDAIERYHETDDKGVKAGFEGAVEGLGAGLARGLVGGFCLLGAGMVYGASQAVKGLGSLQNITKGTKMANEAMQDYDRLTDAPIMSLVLQKGLGLEDFLLQEEERLQKEQEAKEKAEFEKKEWYRLNPGLIHPSDQQPAAEPVEWNNVFNVSNIPFVNLVAASGGGVRAEPVVNDATDKKVAHRSDELHNVPLSAQ